MKIIHYLLFIALSLFIRTEPTSEEALDTLISYLPKIIDSIKQNMPQIYKDNSALINDIETKYEFYKSLTESFGKQYLNNTINDLFKTVIPEDDLKDLQKFFKELIPYINLSSIKVPTILVNNTHNTTEPIPDNENQEKEEKEEEEFISQDTLNQNNFTIFMILSIIIEIILLILVGIYIVTKRRLTKKEIEFVRKDFQSLEIDSNSITESRSNSLS